MTDSRLAGTPLGGPTLPGGAAISVGLAADGSAAPSNPAPTNPTPSNPAPTSVARVGPGGATGGGAALTGPAPGAPGATPARGDRSTQRSVRLGHDPALSSAYREHDRRIRLRYSEAACLLIAVTMPAGISLDYFVYPAQLREFLLVRLGVALVAFAILALHQTPLGARHVRLFGLLPPLLSNVAICWMIYRSEGSASPYYAGLNLVLFGIAVLLPWSFSEALLASGLTLALYSLASFAGAHALVISPVFFNNTYFLLIASVICCTSAFMKSRARRAEFELQAQLARSNAQLTHMERLKTQFFANISHELRTPLMLILSPLEDSLRRAEGEASNEAPGSGPVPASPTLDAGASVEPLRIAYQNALRLLKLINDLLEFVRIDAGAQVARKEPIEIRQFVHAQVEALRPLAALSSLDVSVHLPAQPAWVSCDPSHLERILVNLLTNAIKYTPPLGRVDVHLSARPHSVLVDVTDTGIGIREDDLALIFNRFRQADNARSMSARGMGIGLALAKELSEENDGKLFANSRLGVGTSMQLELPRIPAPADVTAPDLEGTFVDGGRDPLTEFSLKADRAHPHQLGAAPAANGTERSGRARVLIVDDEPDMRRYVSWTLANDYELHEASNGRTGLEAALSLRPEVVVVDQMMPEMEGIELCARLRLEPEELRPRVIMITARSDDTTRLNALSRGADDFLEKPFSGPELSLRVANLVQARALEQRLREQNQQLSLALERITRAELELVANEKFAALGRMAGGLLHELNNPLNNALTAVAIARERASGQDASSREIIADVEAGLRRVRDVIAAVRAFSHPSNSAQFRPLLLNRIIEIAHAQTRGDLGEIEARIDVPPDVWVSGVEAQLIQVLTNLLTNAAEAIRRVSVTGRVEVRVDLTDDRANVQVLDDGPGIPEELLQRVVEPFVTSKAPGQGMGLGLAICDRLVRNHGSGITVRARPEGGTLISFDLRRSEPTQV